MISSVRRLNLIATLNLSYIIRHIRGVGSDGILAFPDSILCLRQQLMFILFLWTSAFLSSRLPRIDPKLLAQVLAKSQPKIIVFIVLINLQAKQTSPFLMLNGGLPKARFLILKLHNKSLKRQWESGEKGLYDTYKNLFSDRVALARSRI